MVRKKLREKRLKEILYYCIFCKKVGSRPDMWKKDCLGSPHFIQRVYPIGSGKSNNSIVFARLLKKLKLKGKKFKEVMV